MDKRISAGRAGAPPGRTTGCPVGRPTSWSRHAAARGAASGQIADSLPVPAGGTLDMSPFTSDVTVPATARWRAGDRVPFTLRFEHSGRVEASAVVVRPGDR
ncbi:copper chaperone PCu(A)C [Streptomyces sp. S465]|uniref:copper chaperone PCu(A)C n=1 Tax=Streptomyces sp. S465 TaxID=2979468 RepID=UPI002E32D6D9|nr:copper chaperone PCu(A)C [Streptomyces sp. S465]